MSIQYGDVPEWVASIGTVAAFAAVAVQIRLDQNRRHKQDEYDEQERYRSQATLISSMPGPIEPAIGQRLSDGRSAIDCFNGSSEPVYNVVVGIVFLQGAGPRTTEDMMKLRLKGENREGVPTTTLSILPPGRSRAWVQGTHWTGVMAGRAGTEIAFTDRSGSNWIRRVNGEIEELPSDPLTYFGQFNFNGPYEFQTPEPLR